jgi:nucleoside-diphosphate-sugar epimerase
MSAEVSKFKVIITGATGMLGEGVLLQCLEHSAIGQVLIVNREAYSAKHPKLQECIVPNFLDLDGFANQLTGYDACFYCAGVSSTGMSEAEYTHITYDTTIRFAQQLAGPQSTNDFQLCLRCSHRQL